MNNENRTAEIFRRAERQKKTRKRAFIAVGASLAVAAVGCTLFVPYGATPAPDLSRYRQSEYYSLIETISRINYRPQKAKSNAERLWEGLEGMFVAYGTASDSNTAAEAPTASANGEYVETTDNQTYGVIEGDKMKRTDEYIFYLSHEEDERTASLRRFVLSVYSIDGRESTKVSEYAFSDEDGSILYDYADGAEMYLSADGNTVTIVSGGYHSQTRQSRTAVYSLDTSDVRNIRRKPTYYVSGGYRASRLTKEGLLLVTSMPVYNVTDFDDEDSFLPCYGRAGEEERLPMSEISLKTDDNRNAYYTIVSLFDGEKISACKAWFDYLSDVYVAQENIYLYSAGTKREGNTYSACTYISRARLFGGALTKENDYTVSGRVHNRYALDEYEGVLRVVTERSGYVLSESGRGNSSVSSAEFTERGAALYCLNVQTGETIASLTDFAPREESVKAVRFEGTQAFVCTAVVSKDPVFVIDLSDYEHITCKDTGEIPGYSIYLRSFGEGYLLGLGYGGNGWYSSDFKAEIYAEGENGVSSVAVYTANGRIPSDYKAYFVDGSNGYIGMGLYGYGSNEYRLLFFDGTDILEYARVELSEETDVGCVRAFVSDGFIYVVASSGVHVLTAV